MSTIGSSFNTLSNVEVLQRGETPRARDDCWKLSQSMVSNYELSLPWMLNIKKSDFRDSIEELLTALDFHATTIFQASVQDIENLVVQK